MIISFADSETEDIFNGVSNKRSRKRRPPRLWKGAAEKLDALEVATKLQDLTIPSGNKLHPLRGDREGQHAIWINDQYRICFVWTPTGPDRVEITDYH
jgi:proteic killer suppression protein